MLGYSASFCGRRLALPLLSLLAITAAVLWLRPPLPGADPGIRGSAALWLHLPALVITIAALTSTVESWPLLTRDRPGAAHLHRLAIGPLRGSGAACVGGLLVLALALTIIGGTFHTLLGLANGARPSHAHASLNPSSEILDAERRAIALHAPATAVHSIRIRALAAGAPGQTTAVELRAGGRPLHPDPIVFRANEVFEIPCDNRILHDLVLRREAGPGLVLAFPAGSIDAELSTEYSSALNAILAALAYLVPAVLAVAVLLLSRRCLALPIAQLTAAGIVTGSTVLDLTPNATAIQAFARGRWLLTENLGPPVFSSLSVAAAAILVAAWFEKRNS